MVFKPYIFFYGRCAEALEFYKSALGGTYEATRIGDSPMAEHSPPHMHDKIMHANFSAPGIEFLASDGTESKAVDPKAGNISLSIEADDRATGERIFAALAQGGNVTGQLQDAFWGGRFGSVEDRFGTEWFVSTP